MGNKPWQLSREVGMSGGGTNKIHQLLTDKVVESGLEPETCLDCLSCLTLLDPNLMRFACIHSPPPSFISVAGFFVASHSLNFDHRRRPETFRTAMATAFFCPD